MRPERALVFHPSERTRLIWPDRAVFPPARNVQLKKCTTIWWGKIRRGCRGGSQHSYNIRCVSVCLSIYLSVCLSVCLCIYLSVCVSVCLYVCMYVCLPVRLSVRDRILCQFFQIAPVTFKNNTEDFPSKQMPDILSWDGTVFGNPLLSLFCL